MDKDIIAEAKERFAACREFTREQRDDMLDDLRFSNPADPQQWPEEIKRLRSQAVGGPRPCLTFDQTNQYIAQVVNESRQNKPSIKVRPVDSKADVKVADALSGMFRHIEDYSRADIAYDTAIEHAARIGLGYLRVNTRVLNPATNEQDILIQRVADPLSVELDPDWQEPDGSDANFGFIESTLSRRAFAIAHPDAKLADWRTDTLGWVTDKGVRVAEYFNLVESKQNMLVMDDPAHPGEDMVLTEAEYWEGVKATGVRLPILRSYWAKTKTCKWYKLGGDEVLEESVFPASYVPLVPVIGSELWIEGKRHLCGMVRPMKDPMRAYNYDRSNYIEQVSLQTKVPYLVAAEAVEGYENEWRAANQSNASYLPWNHLDSDGNPLPAPRREQAPQASPAYAQGAMQAQNDIQASIGMYRASLGAPSNETSGKAINARQRQGETANFHYSDNMSRSLRQVGRIIMEMLPVVIDTKREMRILGEDGSASSVVIDPNQAQGAVMRGNALASFNPMVGKYDVTVTVGPAFGSRRQEAVLAMQEMIGGNPQLFTMLGDEFVKMMDIPGAEKIAKRLSTMLPPQVQEMEAAENQKDGAPSPEVQQVIQQAQAAIAQRDQAGQQLSQQLQQAMGELARLQAELADKEADRQADVYKEEVKAQATVQTAQIEAEAEVETARLQAFAQPVQQQSAPQPVQIINPGVETDMAGVAILAEQVQGLAHQLSEQNLHIYGAISDVVAQMQQPKQERSVVSGRMVRQADGSYAFDAVKDEVTQ